MGPVGSLKIFSAAAISPARHLLDIFFIVEE
jgi:hypothetical protein